MLGVKKFNKILNNEQGVSLMELVVAMTIFIVMVISIGGIFGQIINSQRSSVASKNIQESLSYTLEVMSKEVRAAVRDNFRSPMDCPLVVDSRIYSTSTPEGELLFQNKDGLCVRYFLNNSTLMIERSDLVNTIVASATPSQIKITNLDFVVTDDDFTQPLVTIKIEAESASSKADKQHSVIQTTLSARYYEHN